MYELRAGGGMGSGPLARPARHLQRPARAFGRVVAGYHRETGLGSHLDDAGAHSAGAEDADLAGVRLR